ncbi:MAG: HupE/UreJ family protein [Gammaproteobacteria bacterium]|nr:HupE/UreJ family protein [Gammaproteobacteria bacterium]
MRVIAWCILLKLLFTGTPVNAHEIQPLIATLDLAAGEFTLAVQLNGEAFLAGIGPGHADTSEAPQAGEYDRLRRLPGPELSGMLEQEAPRVLAALELRLGNLPASAVVADTAVPEVGDTRLARRSVVSFRGPVPAGGSSATLRCGAPFAGCVFRYRDEQERVQAQWLRAGQSAEPIPLEAAAPVSAWSAAWRYLQLGYTHILPLGLDHILFVLGLFLLSTRLSSLLWQVTAFTVAHTATLGLAVYGVIRLSPLVVEPLIALSIVWIAVENVLSPRLRPWRVFVVFSFGLLHGLGFAGVLQELGLPREHFLLALLTFNAGVELGQLSVLLAAFALVGWYRGHRQYRRRVAIPASLAIAAVGGYWTVERLGWVIGGSG